MTNKSSGWLMVAAGLVLIAVYSGIMIGSEGASGWAWLILVAGIGLLVLGGRQAARSGG